MLKKENTGHDGGVGSDNGGSNNWARVCDTCLAAACTVYCKADSAYLCPSCDSRIHAANRVASRHERVWVCEACERSPAMFFCKADAASLCSECDASIHSANPLARRHQRVPILPISGDLYCHHVAAGESNEDLFISEDGEEAEEEEEDETASWLLLNPAKKKNNNQNNNNNGFLFGGEVDEYLDLVEYNSNSCPENQYTDNNNQQYNYKNYGSDESVVPVQCEEAAKDRIHLQYHNFQLGLEFESLKPSYSFNGSINHGVPISSMEVGIVPDPTMGEVSISLPTPQKGTTDLFTSPGMQISCLLSPRDREARVLRYREKKKARKFEKTIRYASRKAYAETRPRIKGRFAKRTHPDQVEVDHMFSTALITDTGYGVVPQF